MGLWGQANYCRELSFTLKRKRNYTPLYTEPYSVPNPTEQDCYSRLSCGLCEGKSCKCCEQVCHHLKTPPVSSPYRSEGTMCQPSLKPWRTQMCPGGRPPVLPQCIPPPYLLSRVPPTCPCVTALRSLMIKAEKCPGESSN